MKKESLKWTDLETFFKHELIFNKYMSGWNCVFTTSIIPIGANQPVMVYSKSMYFQSCCHCICMIAWILVLHYSVTCSRFCYLKQTFSTLYPFIHVLLFYISMIQNGLWSSTFRWIDDPVATHIWQIQLGTCISSKTYSH